MRTVPNSDLISGVVTNWVLNDNTGRIIIPVGVDYGSDPDRVRVNSPRVKMMSGPRTASRNSTIGG